MPKKKIVNGSAEKSIVLGPKAMYRGPDREVSCNSALKMVTGEGVGWYGLSAVVLISDWLMSGIS